MTGAKEVSVSEMKDEGVNNSGNRLQRAFKVFSDIFIPIIPAFIGAAMVLGIRSLITTPGMFGMDGSFADHNVFLNDLSEFSISTALRPSGFKAIMAFESRSTSVRTAILGLLVGFVMIHPGLANRNDFVMGTIKPDYWHLFGLSIPAVAFQGVFFQQF
ncbi:hypothetical protein EfmAA96_18770 [Enterococcus faecium]|nr:hypothetical protein EfmAA96_18770 [Enterococcus faecium]